MLLLSLPILVWISDLFFFRKDGSLLVIGITLSLLHLMMKLVEHYKVVNVGVLFQANGYKYKQQLACGMDLRGR